MKKLNGTGKIYQFITMAQIVLLIMILAVCMFEESVMIYTYEATDDIFIQPQGSEDGIKVIGDGAVELYHDNTKRLETASGGINVGTGITMDGNGIAVAGILTANGVTVGQNAIGARTVQSGGSPSGEANGDIYYIY